MSCEAVTKCVALGTEAKGGVHLKQGVVHLFYRKVFYQEQKPTFQEEDFLNYQHLSILLHATAVKPNLPGL